MWSVPNGRFNPISVTDLALATGMNASAVSQVLRLLRGCGAVTSTRDGRVIRYQLADDNLGPIVAITQPTHTDGSRSAHR